MLHSLYNSLQDGYVIAKLKLSSPPVGPIILADLNNDGLVDLVVESNAAYTGYVLSLSGASVVSQFVGGMLVLISAAVLSVVFMQQVMNHY